MHDDPDSRAAADRLDAAWDDLLRGGRPTPATPADASRAALIARLEALAPRAEADARSRVRLRALASRHQETAMPSHALQRTTTGVLAPLPLPPAWEDRGRWRRPVAALHAVVAGTLILATVATVLLIPRNDERPSLPAASSPQGDAATPRPSGQGKSVLHLQAHGTGSIPLTVVVYRVTLQPGESSTVALDEIRGVSIPVDQYVESGTLTIEARGQSHVVAAGQSFGMDGAPDGFRNNGLAPVTFLFGGLAASDPVGPIPPESSGVRLIVALPVPSLADASAIDITLHRLDYKGEGVDPFPIMPGTYPMLVAVESGSLRVNTQPGALVGAINSLRDIGSGAAITSSGTPTPVTSLNESGAEGIQVDAGESLQVDGLNDITGMEVVGDKPLGAFVLTVGVRLFADVMPTLDSNSVTFAIDRRDGRIGFQLYRITLGPQAVWRYQADAPVVVQVVDGSAIVSSGSAPPLSLGPSGSMSYSGPDGFEIHATNTGPAELIAAVAYVEGAPPTVSLAGEDQPNPAVLIGSGTTTLPENSAALSLALSTIPSDAASETVDFRLSAVSLTSVLAGEIDVVRYGGEVGIVHNAVAGVDGETGMVQEHAFGATALARAGDVVIAQPRSAFGFAGRGVGAALVATLTISSDSSFDLRAPGPRGDEPRAVYAADCRIQPRSADDLRRLVDQETSGPGPLDPGLREQAALASPSDPAASTAVAQTVGESLACLQYGSPLQGYAFFSENALLALIAANGITLDNVDAMEQPTPTQADPSLESQTPVAPTIFTIDRVVVYPDGRAGAWMFAAGELAYLTFVFDDASGRWLIDAWDDRPRELEGAATPAP